MKETTDPVERRRERTMWSQVASTVKRGTPLDDYCYRRREAPYETTAEGDQFLRIFIIRWMEAHGMTAAIPAAATPSELLEAIKGGR
jgi:hypothetical protein